MAAFFERETGLDRGYFANALRTQFHGLILYKLRPASSGGITELK